MALLALPRITSALARRAFTILHPCCTVHLNRGNNEMENNKIIIDTAVKIANSGIIKLPDIEVRTSAGNVKLLSECISEEALLVYLQDASCSSCTQKGLNLLSEIFHGLETKVVILSNYPSSRVLRIMENNYKFHFLAVGQYYQTGDFFVENIACVCDSDMQAPNCFKSSFENSEIDGWRLYFSMVRKRFLGNTIDQRCI